AQPGADRRRLAVLGQDGGFLLVDELVAAANLEQQPSGRDGVADGVGRRRRLGSGFDSRGLGRRFGKRVALGGRGDLRRLGGGLRRCVPRPGQNGAGRTGRERSLDGVQGYPPSQKKAPAEAMSPWRTPVSVQVGAIAAPSACWPSRNVVVP